MEDLKSLSHREIIARYHENPSQFNETTWRGLIGTAMAISAQSLQQKRDWSIRVNTQTEIGHEKTRPESARLLMAHSLELKLNPDGKTLHQQLTLWYGSKKS